ncbi:MAG: hypothetical protein ACTSRP_14495 [Candidatus Helarchaeota archaeon]
MSIRPWKDGLECTKTSFTTAMTINTCPRRIMPSKILTTTLNAPYKRVKVRSSRGFTWNIKGNQRRTITIS